MGVGTRTQVKDMLKKGLVTVDDIIVKDPGLKIDTTALSIIKVSGEVISYSEYEYSFGSGRDHRPECIKNKDERYENDFRRRVRRKGL